MRSIGRLVAPVVEPLSTVIRGRGLSRRLEAFEVPLKSMLAAAHTTNASLNDAFLAGIAAGMRRYHELHDSPVPALRVTMPINIRRPDDQPGSNHFAPARFTLPISTTDARERMQQLGALARQWRTEPALSASDAIAEVLNRLPLFATVSLFGSMLKGIDLVATNVPGDKHKAYLAGAEVLRQYAFAPPSGAALSIRVAMFMRTTVVLA